MAVEIVVFIPILMALAMLMVAFGRKIDTEGAVEAVARDAVRAASLERNFGAGQMAMNDIVAASLPDHVTCDNPVLGGIFESGEIITVTLNCEVSLSGLGLIGLDGTVPIEETSTAPIDRWRRTG